MNKWKSNSLDHSENVGFCLHWRVSRDVFAGPYSTTTANVSAVFDTQLTPSGWTFNIWSVIYIWLTAMIIYILSGLCRKSVSLSHIKCNACLGPTCELCTDGWEFLFRRNGDGYVYCSPAVLPYGFFISWCVNLCFNIGWLLVWDRGWGSPQDAPPACSFVPKMSDTDQVKLCFPPSPLVHTEWWFLLLFFWSWSSAPTTPWCSLFATVSIFMELGSISTKMQSCGSSVCWLVWQNSAFVPSCDRDEDEVRRKLTCTWSLLCFSRSKTAWWFTQHGQPLRPSSTWPSSWPMTWRCPQPTLPPSLTQFWLLFW